MAVVVQYLVVRNGIEKMTFTSKKEADAYDKQLDIAEVLQDFLNQADLGIDADKLEALAFYLAQHSNDVTTLLKGGRLSTEATQETATVTKKSDNARAKPKARADVA